MGPALDSVPSEPAQASRRCFKLSVFEGNSPSRVAVSSKLRGRDNADLVRGGRRSVRGLSGLGKMMLIRPNSRTPGMVEDKLRNAGDDDAERFGVTSSNIGM